MERLKALHTVKMADERMAGSGAKSALDAIDYKLQPPSKSVFKPLSVTRSEIKRALADLRVMMRTEDEVIVEHRLTN